MEPNIEDKEEQLKSGDNVKKQNELINIKTTLYNGLSRFAKANSKTLDFEEKEAIRLTISRCYNELEDLKKLLGKKYIN